ncbi:glycosyltransferase family 4 protein [Flavobacterium sp. HJJ]|uniref:glycosyltransferase family 4 protein n=1 Tax=Flavobacterium sp. HJJ TaxID=2783792 RepID=UPI00188B2428|nr:glycosyltransferase family 4 protein [Flavobacterium sp. HJJ]MBF4470274.1 glycosyltransferase family 4 protein [Flavobacterium sp. HJJ]
MRIAYILPSLINKGPVIVANTIIKNIVQKVEKIDVYYFDDDIVLEFPCATQKIYMNVPINFDYYDVIHTHGFRPDRYIKKWRSRILKAKTVCTIHADIAEDFKYGYNKLFSMIFTPIWLNMMKKHDAVVVISDKLKLLYNDKFENLFRVYNGVDIDLDVLCVEEEYVEKINEFKKRNLKIIGSYAALNKRKGIDQVVRLLNKRKDLALVFIGEGNEIEKLKNLAQKLNVHEQIIFFPYLKRPYNYLHLFDVYIMPSRSEGFGLAMVEAALTRTAIVCSDIEVFREIFTEDEATFFTLEDIKSLDYAITESLETKNMKSNNALLKAKNNFSGEKMGENYLKFYSQIVK